MIGPTRLWPHTFVPRHVCDHTRLCPDTFVPRHVCAHTRLCPDTFVPRHICAQTRLCPDMIVARHVCAQTRLCPDTSRIIVVPQHELLWPGTNMSLVNNNIIIVSTRLCVNLIGENTSTLNCCWRSQVKCDYLTILFSKHQQYSHWNISLFYYNMSGHQIWRV